MEYFWNKKPSKKTNKIAIGFESSFSKKKNPCCNKGFHNVAPIGLEPMTLRV